MAREPGSFALSSSDAPSGVASWRYWLDSGTPTTVAGGSAASVSIIPPNGWHTLHVQAVDKAGNARTRRPTPSARSPA